MTLAEIVAALKVNYPKQDARPVTQPTYQVSADEYNLVVQGLEQAAQGGGISVDEELDDTSTNPVQNKTIAGALDGKVGGADIDDGDFVLYSDAEKTNEISRVNLNVNRILNFEIDNSTGCLMMTEENMGGSMDFEIDEYGNFKVIIEEQS